MNDLTQRLRALSRHEHDDLSIGDEAADEIERLQRQLDAGTEAGWHALRNERDALRSRIEGAVSGVVLRVGDDENGIPRVIVHCSREALSSGPNLIGKRVRLVAEDEE